jgi:hypothetical protein
VQLEVWLTCVKEKKKRLLKMMILTKEAFVQPDLLLPVRLPVLQFALLTAGSDNVAKWLEGFSAEHALTTALGSGGYQILGVLFFAAMGLMLYRAGMRKNNDEIMKS